MPYSISEFINRGLTYVKIDLNDYSVPYGIIIGKNGKTINEMKRKSRAKICIEEVRDSNAHRIAVCGTSQQVQIAQKLIHQLWVRWHNKNKDDADSDTDTNADSGSDCDSESDSYCDDDSDSDIDSKQGLFQNNNVGNVAETTPLDGWLNDDTKPRAESKEGPSSSTSARYSQFLRRLRERREHRKIEVRSYLEDNGLQKHLSRSGVPEEWYRTILWHENEIEMLRLRHNQELKIAEANAEANAKTNLVDAKIAKENAKAKVVDRHTLLDYIEFLINLDGRCSRVGLINPTHWNGDRSQSEQVKTWLDVLSGKSNSSPVITIENRTTHITVLDRE